jgi:hypothetical protein
LNFLKVSLEKPILLEKCHGHGHHGHFLVTQFFFYDCSYFSRPNYVAGYIKIRPKVKWVFLVDLTFTKICQNMDLNIANLADSISICLMASFFSNISGWNFENGTSSKKIFRNSSQ